MILGIFTKETALPIVFLLMGAFMMSSLVVGPIGIRKIFLQDQQSCINSSNPWLLPLNVTRPTSYNLSLSVWQNNTFEGVISIHLNVCNQN
jgi:hypothetical protein